MGDREFIIERVRKLLALADNQGATPAESATAAKMAAKLMSEYQLSDSDVRISVNEMGTTSVDIKKGDVATAMWACSSREGSGWRGTLAMATAKAMNCQCLRLHEGIQFIGAFQDAAVAVEVLSFLVKRGDQAAKQFAKQRKGQGLHGKTISASFRNGFAQGAYRAIIDEVQDRLLDKVERLAQSTTGTSLMVVVSMSDVVHAKKEAVSSWVTDQYGKLGKGRRSQSVSRDATAYHAGRAEGSKVKVGDGAKLH